MSAADPAERSVAWWRDRWCLACLALALLVRVAWSWNLQGLEASDPVEYDAIGWNVAQGFGFTNRGLDAPESRVRRPPGYPAFLGAVYFVFGHDLFAVRMAQAAVGTLLCAVTIALAARVASRGTVNAVAAASAVYPYLVYYSGYVMSETLATLLFYAAFPLLLREPLRAGPAIAAGMVLALATLTRSMFLGFLGPIALWRLGSTRTFGRAAREASAVVLGAVLLIAPWVARNYAVTGRFIPVQSDSVAGFYRWHVWFSEDDSRDRESWERFEKRHPEIFRMMKDLDDVEQDRALAREAVRYVVEDPVRYLRSCVRKFLWLWRPSTVALSGTQVVWRRAYWVSLAAYFVWLPVFAWGLFLLWRRGPAGQLLVWAVIYVTAFHTFYWYGSPRFRFPVYPVFLIACAVAAEHAWGLWIRGRR